MCGHEIRKDDLVAAHPAGGEKYHIFLSRAREKWQTEIGDLETVALRVQEFLYNRLFGVFFSRFERGPRIMTGYGMSYFPPNGDHEALIRDLIGEAERVAPFLSYKIGLIRRVALHDVLSNRKVLVNYQPVVLLGTNRVLGWELEAGAPEETLLGKACNLANFARETGLAGELAGVSFDETLAKARGLDRGAFIFLAIDPDIAFADESKAVEFSRRLERYEIEEERLVFQVRVRPHPDAAAALGGIASRFPRARISAELDDAWTAGDLPLLGELAPSFSRSRSSAGPENVRTAGDFPLFDGRRLGFVKAGREVLFREDGDKGGRAFAAALASAVRRLGLVLIAGGVTNAEEAGAAEALGASAGQGPFFTRAENTPDGLEFSGDEFKDRFFRKKLLLSIYLKRGRDYFHRGDFDKSVLEFSKVIEIDPLNAESFYFRGRAFCSDGVLGLAVKDYLKLKELDPDFPNARLLEGVIAEKKGDGERALQAYREYLERTAQSFDAEIAFARSRIDLLRKDP